MLSCNRIRLLRLRRHMLRGRCSSVILGRRDPRSSRPVYRAAPHRHSKFPSHRGSLPGASPQRVPRTASPHAAAQSAGGAGPSAESGSRRHAPRAPETARGVEECGRSARVDWRQGAPARLLMVDIPQTPLDSSVATSRHEPR